MTKEFATCKECSEEKYSYDGCPYQHAQDLIKAHDYLKEKYGDDFPELLNVESLKPQAALCKQKINETVRQQEMFDRIYGLSDMKKQIKKLTDIIDASGNIKTKAKEEPHWKMWRPDIKPDKVPEAVKQLKEKHPDVTDKQIDISTNKHDNATIKYKL